MIVFMCFFFPREKRRPGEHQIEAPRPWHGVFKDHPPAPFFASRWGVEYMVGNTKRTRKTWGNPEKKTDEKRKNNAIS